MSTVCEYVREGVREGVREDVRECVRECVRERVTIVCVLPGDLLSRGYEQFAKKKRQK